MPITAGNLHFVAAERMIDNLSADVRLGGGGAMGSEILQDSIENNLFPDVMPGDRVAGTVQYRKSFAAVLSNENDAASNARVGLAERPSAVGVHLALARIPAAVVSSQARAALRPALAQGVNPTYGTTFAGLGGGSGTGSGVFTAGASLIAALAVGDKVDVEVLSRDADGRTGSGSSSGAATFSIQSVFATVTAVDSPAGTVTVDCGGRVFPATFFFDVSAGTVAAYYRISKVTVRLSPAVAEVSALSLSTATSGASSIELDRLFVRTEQQGLAVPGLLETTDNQWPLYFPGDQVLLQHPTVPATREWATISRVDYVNDTLVFTAALVNSYPIDTLVTRPLRYGTLRGSLGVLFSQQAWGNTWASAATGAAITALYTGAVPMTNEGAVTERWACVFTSATQFNLIGERLGQVAVGNVATDFAPLNPLTDQPFFTLLAAGWGPSRLPGNALRFDTVAAAAEVWAARLVEPGAAAGTDQGLLFLEVDVDA